MTAAAREFTIGIVCALSVVVLWSSFHLVSRIGVQSNLTPYDLVTLRVGVSGIIMLPVLVRHGIGHLRLWQALVLALIAGPGFGLTAFSGYQFAPVAHTNLCGLRKSRGGNHHPQRCDRANRTNQINYATIHRFHSRSASGGP